MAGRVFFMFLDSFQSCGPTACGNIYSKEKASDASAVSVVSVLSLILYLLSGSQHLLLCSCSCILSVFCRADNHPGVPGQQWSPVQTDQKTLVTALKTTCCLVR